MGPDHHRRADAQCRRPDPALEGRSLTQVVVDASFVLEACLEEVGFGVLEGHDAVAPTLMWSEVLSTLHEAAYRGEVSPRLADLARSRLWAAPVRPAMIAEHGEDAWLLAEELGWAKTYDAEYVALARQLGCPLLTLDRRLQREAGHVVRVIGPRDVEELGLTPS